MHESALDNEAMHAWVHTYLDDAITKSFGKCVGITNSLSNTCRQDCPRLIIVTLKTNLYFTLFRYQKQTCAQRGNFVPIFASVLSRFDLSRSQINICSKYYRTLILI